GCGAASIASRDAYENGCSERACPRRSRSVRGPGERQAEGCSQCIARDARIPRRSGEPVLQSGLSEGQDSPRVLRVGRALGVGREDTEGFRLRHGLQHWWFQGSGRCRIGSRTRVTSKVGELPSAAAIASRRYAPPPLAASLDLAIEPL